jgi:hypothetical protein
LAGQHLVQNIQQSLVVGVLARGTIRKPWRQIEIGREGVKILSRIEQTESRLEWETKATSPI